MLLTDDEWGGLRVKVTDFGIAKAGSGLGADLTRTGIVLGTPKYLSPEQISGKEPDARADLYSLGVVLFEMISGAPPFVGNTDMTTALAHLNDRPPRLSSRAPDVPPPLDRLVADLLAKDPQRRVPSAYALRQRLDELGLWAPGPSGGNGRRPGWRHRDAVRANRLGGHRTWSHRAFVHRVGSSGVSHPRRFGQGASAPRVRSPQCSPPKVGARRARAAPERAAGGSAGTPTG